MKIGNWELRKPWVRYVKVELEEQFYNEIRKSIGEDIAKEIESEILTECGTAECRCDIRNSVLQLSADIAKGKYNDIR